MSDASVQKDMDEDLLSKYGLRSNYLFDWEEREKNRDLLGSEFFNF